MQLVVCLHAPAPFWFVDRNSEVPVSSPRMLFRHLLLIACFALLAVSAAKAQTIVQQNVGFGQLNCGSGCTQMPLGVQPGGVSVTTGNAIVVTVIWISGQPITVSDNNGNTYFQAAYLNTSVLIDPGTAIFYACNVASTPNPKPVITAIDPSGAE